MSSATGGSLSSDSASSFEHEDGLRVNACSVEELFALYERTGFLYAAKAARLLPHMAVVRENWRRLLTAGDSLLYVLSAGSDADGRASAVVWRTTHGSWVWQHLVSEGNPLRSRTVMLGGVNRCIRMGIARSQQNWFRPENRFPARVFGTMVDVVGAGLSSVQRYMFFAVPRRLSVPQPPTVQVVPFDASHQAALHSVALRSRGAVYIAGEALDRDVTLAAIDALYRAVGLRRTRHVWLAYRGDSDEASGAAIAYRGPLGLNFSFLENRCDLLVDPRLSPEAATAVTVALMDKAADAYADFELDDIPVVADRLSATALTGWCGGQFLRNYCQGIWLEDGQPLLYRHVERFYSRLLHRVERRGVATALTA